MKTSQALQANCCIVSQAAQAARLAQAAERSAQWRWGGFVVLLLSGSVGAWIYAAVLAVSDPSMAVVPDYHEKALRWDEHLAAERASQSVGWTTAIVPGAIDGLAKERELTVFLRDRNAQPVVGATGHVRCYHHARASAVFETEFQEKDPGSYSCKLPMARAGQWQMELKFQRSDERFESSTIFELASE